MTALRHRIAALIAAQGPISIAEFMTIALHDPAEGYYATRDPFGVAGDFITAPEISQVFGEMLGLWCVQVWHDQGRFNRCRLVELGPGRGTLMADALRAMRVASEFLDDLEVVLVEASPALRQVQEQRLKDSGVAIRWVTRFDETLADRPLFLLANEFFDALPVHQYVKTPRGWCERRVALDAAGALCFMLAPVPLPDSMIAADRGDAPDGGVYETSPSTLSLVEDIARIVADQGGGALIIDYGYDRPDFGETLQAVADHAFTAILDEPGESDLSAHVDFAALAAHASQGDAVVFGPEPQGDFLEDIGIAERVMRLSASNPSAADALSTALERLIGPDQMGTLFKALAIMPDGTPDPPGF